eukprot:280055-Pelagomonas_calceolata.AAC.1
MDTPLFWKELTRVADLGRYRELVIGTLFIGTTKIASGRLLVGVSLLVEVRQRFVRETTRENEFGKGSGFYLLSVQGSAEGIFAVVITTAHEALACPEGNADLFNGLWEVNYGRKSSVLCWCWPFQVCVLSACVSSEHHEGWKSVSTFKVQFGAGGSGRSDVLACIWEWAASSKAIYRPYIA